MPAHNGSFAHTVPPPPPLSEHNVNSTVHNAQQTVAPQQAHSTGGSQPVPDWIALLNNVNTQPGTAQPDSPFVPMLPTAQPESQWAQQMQTCMASSQQMVANTVAAQQNILQGLLDTQQKTVTMLAQMQTQLLQSDQSSQSSQNSQTAPSRKGFCKLCNQSHAMNKCTHPDSFATQCRQGTMPRNIRLANGKPIPPGMIYEWMIEYYNASPNANKTTLDAERDAARANKAANSSLNVAQVASNGNDNAQIHPIIANQVASQVAAQLSQAQSQQAQPVPVQQVTAQSQPQSVAQPVPAAPQFAPLNPTN